MTENLVARMVRPYGIVEVRTRLSERRERHRFDDINYQIVRVSRRTPAAQDIFWQISNSEKRPVRGVSIVAPGAPLSIEVSAGETTIVSCLFSADEFHRIMKVEHWTDELTANCLSMPSAFLSSVMDRLAKEIDKPALNSDILLDAVLACIRAEIPNLVPEEDEIRVNPGGLSKAQLKTVVDLVAQNVGSRARITQEDLAARCSLGVRHLQRGFKASTGQPIQFFIRQARLQRAKDLLTSEQPRLSLREIAFKAGFATSSHFSAEFRRLTGCSPSHWARSRK